MAAATGPKHEAADEVKYRENVYSMTGVTFSTCGDPSSVIRIESDIPRPPVPANHLLIKVAAVGMNPLDWKVVKGIIKPTKTTEDKQARFTPGYEFSGWVAQLPPNTTGDFQVGDQVFGVSLWRGGCFAEYVTVPMEMVAKKPAKLSMKEAAAVGLSGLTSMQVIMDVCKMRFGQRLLIIGGSTSAGMMAIQLARICRVFVTATARRENENQLKELGAHRVILYDPNNADSWMAHPDLNKEKFDVVYDCIGGVQHWKTAASKLLTKDGIFVTLVGDNKMKEKSLGQAMATANRQLFSMQHYEHFLVNTQHAEGQLATLVALIDEGALKPIVSPHVYRLQLKPLDVTETIGKQLYRQNVQQLIDMFKLMEQGHGYVGKIVAEINVISSVLPVQSIQGQSSSAVAPQHQQSISNGHHDGGGRCSTCSASIHSVAPSTMSASNTTQHGRGSSVSAAVVPFVPPVSSLDSDDEEPIHSEAGLGTA